MCRIAGVGPSLLLHTLDFMGSEDDPDLAFFPAMGCPAEPKVEIVAEMIDMMSHQFEVLPMKDHAAALKSALAHTSSVNETNARVRRR